MDRKKTIANLSSLSEICAGQEIKLTSEDISSIKFALDSLKTDEAYQLEYEGREVYTKDEVFDMLESIQKQIGKYYRIRCEDVHAIIQNKINELRGDE